jgi:hypothetical protein
VASSGNRHGITRGSKVSKPHKERGLISPKAKTPIRGIDPEMLKPKPMSGGKADADRVRLIRNFYSKLPENLIIYQELVEEVAYDNSLNQKRTILNRQVPDDRTFVVDNVEFFATPLFGSGLVPPGVVEGAVQASFQIGNVIPVEISTTRLQPGGVAENRAYFPFFNDRVGAREVNFSLFAKRGQSLKAFYINRVITPVPLRTIGVRIEGWMVDSNAIEELLEQQR